MGICSILGPRTEPGSGSIIPEADPRIQIHIKMKRIEWEGDQRRERDGVRYHHLAVPTSVIQMTKC